MDTSEAVLQVKQLIETQGAAWSAFEARRMEWEAKIEGDLTRMGRPFSGPSDPAHAPTHDTWRDVKTGAAVPILDHKQSLAALEPRAEKSPSFGRLLRGIVLGGRADDARELADERKALSIDSDPSGGYTVAGRLASEWIDSLRAAMVLSAAGARTVPMDGKTLTLARVTADPTVSWHGENATLGTGDPTFGSVKLDAKTAVCLVRLSLELSQDSMNIETILSDTIIRSMAAAIDKAGLVGATVDVGATPTGIMNAGGRSKTTSIGAPTNWDYVVTAMYTLMAANVPMERIGALIGHPAIWSKMRKLKTGIASDLTSLVPPPEVSALPKLWTTAAPFTGGTTCSAIVGDWGDLLFGVRRNITVRVLDQAFMGSNLQLAVLAYARCDFVATREASFHTLEGITI
jgi:HK97 family phage major capsid protein